MPPTLAEAIEYRLGKTLDEAIYDAVADVLEQFGLERAQSETDMDDSPVYDDGSIQLPDGNVMLVEWKATVMTREEFRKR